MTIQPLVFTACYLLGALILAALFLLDELYLDSFFSTWHVEFGLVPILWFAYGTKLNFPESIFGLLTALLIFFLSVYVSLPLVLPDFGDDSWPETTLHSMILLTGMAMTLLLCRRFKSRAKAKSS